MKVKKWKIIQLGSNEELEVHLNMVSREGATVVSVSPGDYPFAVYYYEIDEEDDELPPAKVKKKGK
jgi:hypothetical protein